MLYKGYEMILHSSQIVEICSGTLSELAIFGVIIGISECLVLWYEFQFFCFQKDSKAGFGQTLEKIVCTV